MGQSQQILNKNKDLIEKLTYIQTEQSPHYGQLQVYRLNQKPFDYYLKYRQVHQNVPQSQNAIKANQQLYQGIQGQRNMVKVEVISIKKDVSLCSDAIVVECYARYHNYTLHNAINNKKKSRKMFKDGDLLYIFISLVQAAVRIQQHTDNNYYGLFKATKVFLSTEGFVKLYPFRICQQTMMTQLNYSETQCSSAEREHKSYCTSITDLQDLGFLMAQLCLLQHKQDLQLLSKEHIRYKLDRGLAGRISPRLRYLAIRLLDGQQNSWQLLSQELDNIKSIENIRMSYCIRLEEDITVRASEILEQEYQEMKQMRFSRVEKAQRQQVLSSLQPNLRASKIQPLSRTSRSSLHF